MEINWEEFSPAEKSRTYHFPGGDVVRVDGVARIEIRDSGTHRYETTDRKKGFVAKGWLQLEIDVEKWSL